MQLSKKTPVVVASALSLMCALNANADYIEDAYVGSDSHGYGDVIGNSNWFNVQGVDINLVGNMLSIDVKTSFANNGLGSYTELTNKDLSKDALGIAQGIGFGDLFLANKWTPYGTAPYLSDDAQSGTDWDYGFSLDNRWSASGGAGEWYALDDTQKNGDIHLSEDFLSSGTFRNGQEVAVDKNSSSVTAMQSQSWSVDATENKVSFLFDITGTSLENSSVIGFHWGMSCGNDVIEGAYNVPEPGTFALLGLGLTLMLTGVGRVKRPVQKVI